MKNLKSYLSIGLPAPKHDAMTTKAKTYGSRTITNATSKRRRLIRKLKHQGDLI